MSKTRRQRATDRGDSGQTLVEFALIMPILMVVFAGVIEVALLFNAVVGVNRASQNGAHLAAVLGNQEMADCQILDAIEQDVYAPNEPGRSPGGRHPADESLRRYAR